MEIRDCASIVLYALGLSQPQSWTGRVPSGLFAGVDAMERPVYVIPYEKSYRVRENPPAAPGTDALRALPFATRIRTYLPLDGSVEDTWSPAENTPHGKLYFVDGYFDRGIRLVSELGGIPYEESCLAIFAAMLILCQFGRFPAWALMLVLTREFAVSGLRMVAAAKGSVIAAGWSGKIKTASTMVALCVQMVQPNLFSMWPWVDTLAIVVIVGTTVVSGVEYFWKNGKVLV